jgi:coenzyme F420-reducing hydrogenase alpha subunit
MASDNTKFGHALIKYYISLYTDRYNKIPTVNQYREKWAMIDVADSVGYERAKEILDYYFKTTRPGHPLQWFYYNFDKLDEMMKAVEEDNIRREKIRQQTKAMVEREENEHRISSN